VKAAKAVGIQYAALPWRLVGRRLEILLVTSRETHRWVIPKGGISGEIAPAIGSYRYLKRLKREEAIPSQVIVFPLEVTSELDHWKEKHQRQSRWFPYQKAAGLVAEPALKRIIRDFGQARSSDPLSHAARFGRWMDAAFFGLRRD
jgi:hypothetical protein